MNWEAIELLGQAHYSALGYKILVPLGREENYDFIAKRGEEYVKINVKVAFNKDRSRPNCWSIARSGTQIKRKKACVIYEVDFYLAWIPRKKRFVQVPGDFLNGRGRRHIPQRLIEE